MGLTDTILTARNVSKRFAGVQALDNVDLTMRRGTITALIGENGAGKSTLVKILSGFYKADSGSFFIDGEEVEIRSVHQSSELGISVIHQIPSFAAHMSVVDNIFLGREIPMSRRRGPLRRFDRRTESDRIRPLIEQYSGNFKPSDRMENLMAYQQRLVGILKALVFSARVLILDEPTAALPIEERDLLLTRILKLKDEGYSILYVSHHFDEIERVADDIVALRDGVRVGYADTSLSQQQMVEMMTGFPLDSVSRIYKVNESIQSETEEAEQRNRHVFRLNPPTRGSVTSKPKGSLEIDLQEGEITVLSGLVGSGVKEIGEAMFGMRQDWTTQYRSAGVLRIVDSPSAAISSGIGYLSDDRIGEAIIPDFSVRKNLSIPKLTRVSTFWGQISKEHEQSITQELCGKMSVKMSSPEQAAIDLSGGNQQKVMLARWLYTESKVLILNEPTQGIDVKAKQDVIALLQEFVSQRGACLIVTNDPEEFLDLADRIVVMQRGEISGDFRFPDIRHDDILRAMLINV